MKNIVVAFILLVFALNASAFCALAMQSDIKKITMDPCVMSYTDNYGKGMFVIRSAPLIIFIK